MLIPFWFGTISMKNDIIVVGAGGHCRVLLSILLHYEEYNVVGIADRDKNSLGEKILDAYVQFTWDDFQLLYNKKTIVRRRILG